MLWRSITAAVGLASRSAPSRSSIINVMDGLEQESSRQFSEPAIDRAPVPEMDRQHPPTAA